MIKTVLTSLLNAIIFSLMLFPLALFGQNNPFANPRTGTPLIRSSVLPAEEAFALNTFIEAPDKLVLLWEIQEGYYLYQKSLSVTAPNGDVIDLGELPESRTVTDEFFGESKVYFDRLLHRIPLSSFSTTDNTVSFLLQYQGCAEDKYCYPMQIQEIEIRLPGQ